MPQLVELSIIIIISIVCIICGRISGYGKGYMDGFKNASEELKVLYANANYRAGELIEIAKETIFKIEKDSE